MNYNQTIVDCYMDASKKSSTYQLFWFLFSILFFTDNFEYINLTHK